MSITPELLILIDLQDSYLPKMGRWFDGRAHLYQKARTNLVESIQHRARHILTTGGRVCFVCTEGFGPMVRELRHISGERVHHLIKRENALLGTTPINQAPREDALSLLSHLVPHHAITLGGVHTSECVRESAQSVLEALPCPHGLHVDQKITLNAYADDRNIEYLNSDIFIHQTYRELAYILKK